MHFEVFREMGLTAAVVHSDDPVAIASRRVARDAERHAKEAIAAHQEAELQQARHVAAVLGIPLLILGAFDSAGLVKAIREWRAA